MRKKQSSWQMLFFDVDVWKGFIIFFTSFLKRSLFSSFFGAVCVCCENRGPVVWAENFSLLHKRERTEIFSQFGTKPTMLNLFKLDWGSRGCSIKCLHPDHFFCLDQGKKTWSLKRLRFRPRSSGASYILMLDEQSSQAQNVLHMAKPCFIKRLFRWSIVPLLFHNMKHLLSQIWSTPLTLRMMSKWKMKVFPFVIQHCSHCIVLQERNSLFDVLWQKWGHWCFVRFRRISTFFEEYFTCSCWNPRTFCV